ncbi:carbohydrate ABC transporter permease [Aerococcus tenax]|uniref:carbohydrate ABC transporter permease n=1 Tax=Aerococcus tenax TaxID=3078812 RepID=UPI000DCE4A7A|nr:carbohydrate ABC transporter permease [Aerococcus tenax]
MRNKKWDSKGIIRSILLLFLSFLMVYPLLWMASNAFKDAATILSDPASLAPDFLSFKNFSGVFELGPFDLYIFNSIFTALVIVIVQLVLSALMAYGLVFFHFKGKKFLYTSILLTYMLPVATTYVPSFVILAQMGLLDTLTGLIVSNIASVFSIFYLVQTFRSVPIELVEAGQVEGANSWQILWRIIVPYSRSAILTTALINFVTHYNNYMWPSLIISSEAKMLVSNGLNQLFTTQGNFIDNLPRLMAANTLVVVPLLILFILLQKWFVQGISGSGTKG